MQRLSRLEYNNAVGDLFGLQGDAPSVPPAVVEALRKGLAFDPQRRWASMTALLGVLGSAIGVSARRRRRWVVLAAAATALVGLGAGVQALIAVRAEVCSGAVERLQGTWDADRRVHVRAAILGTDKAAAPSAWERVQTRLDACAEAWRTMHTDACEATVRRREQSPDVMDLRMACLHRPVCPDICEAVCAGEPEPPLPNGCPR